MNPSHHPIAGYDGPVHISEEASNATTAVPIGIVSSLVFAVIIGFGSSVIVPIFDMITHSCLDAS